MTIQHLRHIMFWRGDSNLPILRSLNEGGTTRDPMRDLLGQGVADKKLA